MKMSNDEVRAFAEELLDGHLEDEDFKSRVSIAEHAAESEHSYDGHISDEDAERVYALLSGVRVTYEWPDEPDENDAAIDGLPVRFVPGDGMSETEASDACIRKQRGMTGFNEQNGPPGPND